MPGLFSSLVTAGGALTAFNRVLEVTQNNVSNASTPGYARQSLRLLSLPFDPSTGLQGGVRAGDLESARDEYSEQSVRRETSGLGFAAQQASGLTSLESILGISADSGIPAALNGLFQSFSAWAQTPDSAVARQNVIERASDAAAAFRETATGVSRLAGAAETQLSQTVEQVNSLVAKLAEYNRKSMSGSRNDPGLDALVHSTLEELSSYVDISAVRQENGSTAVLIGGQIPLLLGVNQYKLDMRMAAADAPDYPNAPPAARVTLDQVDITGRIASGKLGALLDVRNRVLPQVMGDGFQQGDLNLLAQQVAGRVNALLTAGNVADGQPPETGVPLFVYDAANAANAAASLEVDPGATAGTLAAIDPGPPYVSNGIPLRLSALASPRNAEDKIQGFSYTEFYGQVAGRVGGELQTANDRQQIQQSTVAQAKSLREQMSGVSLDEQAMIVVEFQRAYQANSRLITMLDQLTEEVINMLR